MSGYHRGRVAYNGPIDNRSVTLRLPAETFAALDRMAVAKNTPRAHILQQIIIEALMPEGKAAEAPASAALGGKQ